MTAEPWTVRLFRRDGVVVGRIGDRWITWDAPWTRDVRDLGVPQRLYWFGRRWCWSVGAPRQVWSWRRSGWTGRYRRFVVYPTDHRERWEAAGRPRIWDWTGA